MPLALTPRRLAARAHAGTMLAPRSHCLVSGGVAGEGAVGVEGPASMALVAGISMLSAMTLVVTFQLLTGRINLQGLLVSKHGSGGLSPARVQSLAFSLMAAFLALGSLEEALTDSGAALQLVPPEMLGLLGGSQALYLWAKRTAAGHSLGSMT